MELVSGEKVSGFVVLRDDGGLRHAVRPGCILAISDADETQGETIVQLPGGRTLLIQRSLDEVLSWFSLSSTGERR